MKPKPVKVLELDDATRRRIQMVKRIRNLVGMARLAKNHVDFLERELMLLVETVNKEDA
jgi:ribosomal protein L7/L12